MSEETKMALDEQLIDWLKKRNAKMVLLGVSPEGVAMSLDNFISADGLKLPANWTLTVTVVEVKPNGAH